MTAGRIWQIGVRLVAAALAGLLWSGPSISSRGDDRDSPPKRALPPKWSRDVLDTFFPDAREQLQGPRPDYALSAEPRHAASSSVKKGEETRTAAGQYPWSQLVQAETLEDEVKRLGRQLPGYVVSTSDFKGGTYRACRRELSLLAVLFGVIGQYDAPVRWQGEAAGYRDLFARAGFNCKVGTDQTFKEAQLRAADLQSIIRGNRVEAPEALPDALWWQVSDRAPLMRRMELSHQERLSKWLAAPAEFRSNLAEIRHEAELLAALAEIISREGYEFWDDDEYAAYAAQLRGAANEIAQAAEAADYDRAVPAMSSVTKACAECHETYR